MEEWVSGDERRGGGWMLSVTSYILFFSFSPDQLHFRSSFKHGEIVCLNLC